jgi:pimeloyl-ACP methyl ester carboxylesterase
MTIRKHNPWEERAQISALVPLPLRGISLFATASGPSRSRKQPSGGLDPVVILFTGAGGPAACYVKVQEHLNRSVRTLFYDRAGYDRSTLPEGDEGLTAEEGAKDLEALLEAINVDPPYLLIAHSFGGIPAREFMHLQLEKKRTDERVTDIIAGMVLYDTASEMTLAFYPRVPPLDLNAIVEPVDWEKLTNLRQESGMTDDQWNYAIEAVARTTAQIAGHREDTHGSAWALAEKKQLERASYGSGILAVVRCNSTGDYQLMYDEGVKLGAGTEEQRENARDFIHKWGLFNHEMIRAQLDLVGSEAKGDNGRKRYIYLPQWGHDSPMRKPALVGDPVNWVLREWKDVQQS